MKDIGSKPVMSANIRRLMAEKGINAKELSKALNVPYTTVLSWINAEYYPRIDKIEMMSDYFGCLKSDLIEDKQKNPVTDNGNGISKAKADLIKKVMQMSDEELKKLDLLLQIVEAKQ